jgi:hypothetical protein
MDPEPGVEVGAELPRYGLPQRRRDQHGRAVGDVERLFDGSSLAHGGDAVIRATTDAGTEPALRGGTAAVLPEP